MYLKMILKNSVGFVGLALSVLDVAWTETNSVQTLVFCKPSVRPLAALRATCDEFQFGDRMMERLLALGCQRCDDKVNQHVDCLCTVFGLRWTTLRWTPLRWTPSARPSAGPVSAGLPPPKIGRFSFFAKNFFIVPLSLGIFSLSFEGFLGVSEARERQTCTSGLSGHCNPVQLKKISDNAKVRTKCGERPKSLIRKKVNKKCRKLRHDTRSKVRCFSAHHTAQRSTEGA